MALLFEPPNYRVGPYQGFRSTGRIDAQEMTLAGDMEITGTLTAAVQVGATTVSGHLSTDVTVDAGTDITAATGACIFNYAGSTGAFTTSSGANTLSGDVTIVAGKKFTHGVEIKRTLTKTAGYTVTDTDPDVVFIGSIGANATFVLPTAADNAGRKIMFVIVADPTTYNVIIDGEGAETINGAASKTNSDQYSMLEVLCDGAGWYITGSQGTWT
jgi:hypothetical protein